MNDTEPDLLRQQIEYYKARASEYDQWFFRQGRYDRGEVVNAEWFGDVQAVREVVAAWNTGGHVLELAAGTGLWTEVLLRGADRVTAVDASSEALELCRERVGADRVETVCADLFSYSPGRKFDAVFFGFWLSHVPPERFEELWGLVDSALVPGGSVFFVDSRFTDRSTARDHQLPSEDGVTVTRRLNDGREFRVVKVFYDPSELTARLAGLGWTFEIQTTSEFFIYGSGTRAR